MKKLVVFLLIASLFLVPAIVGALGDGPACERAKKAWWHPGIVAGCFIEVMQEIWLEVGLQGYYG